MFLRIVGAVLVAALTTSPVMASTTVISELGSAPLLGPSISTTDLQMKIIRNEGRLSRAAARLGLTSREYQSFKNAIQYSDPHWVTLPRHLDAMSWYGHNGVQVIHDVMIPARTKGWEVDINEPGQVLAVFMPVTCGNLSILRRAMPRVAMKKPVVVANRPPWGVMPSRQAAAPAAVAAAPPVAAAPAPEAPIPVAAAPAPGGLGGILPFLLLLLAPGGGGGSGGGPGLNLPPPITPPGPPGPPGPPSGPPAPPPPCVCP